MLEVRRVVLEVVEFSPCELGSSTTSPLGGLIKKCCLQSQLSPSGVFDGCGGGSGG
jgi:hypothetical protein